MQHRSDLDSRIRARIRDEGPILVSDYVSAALYDPAGGFYNSGGRAGRRGDFLTAPEVGPLFGAVITNAIDQWWRNAGEPTEFVVVDWGAGPGTLERAILAAEGDCQKAGALRLVAVELSRAQRELHPSSPALVSVSPSEVPSGFVGAILANELLDNLPFDIVEFTAHGWALVKVSLASEADDAPFVTLVDPASAPIALRVSDGELPLGTRIPLQAAAAAWVDEARHLLHSGPVVAFDYGATTAELAARPDMGWLRTHSNHSAEADWLSNPGTCDITVDVAIDQLAPGDCITQAEFLTRHGIAELVGEGQAAWQAGAARGDLAALKGRSRIREAEALLDTDGMGGFLTLSWPAY